MTKDEKIMLCLKALKSACDSIEMGMARLHIYRDMDAGEAHIRGAQMELAKALDSIYTPTKQNNAEQ